MHRAIGFLVFAIVLVVARSTLANYVPPPIHGHVVDPGNKLTIEQRAAENEKLERYRVHTTNEIAVFIPESLDGNTIEEVALATFNTWKLGTKAKNNGVLLVIAPVERKVRIETGKGVEADLTAEKCKDIIQKLKGRLRDGQWSLAVLDGTSAIIETLEHFGFGAALPVVSNTPPPIPTNYFVPPVPTSAPATTPTTPAATSSGMSDESAGALLIAAIVGVPFLFFLVLSRIGRGGRSFFTSTQSGNDGWDAGGSSDDNSSSDWSSSSSSSSFSSDSSWSSSSSSSDSSSSSSSSSGGDFTGGGGSSSGGGASDSF